MDQILLKCLHSQYLLEVPAQLDQLVQPAQEEQQVQMAQLVLEEAPVQLAQLVLLVLPLDLTRQL